MGGRIRAFWQGPPSKPGPTVAGPYPRAELADRLHLPTQSERHDMPDTSVDLDALTNRWLDLRERRGDIDDELGRIEAQLVAAVPAGKRYEIAPGVGVKVAAPSRRFSRELAAEYLTPNQYAQICVMTPSVELARTLPEYVQALIFAPTPGSKPSIRAL